MTTNHYRVLRTDGSSLHVCVKEPDEGVGHVAIFVHGFLGDGCENHRMFIRMSDALANIGITCVLYDQKGCGYSDGDYADVRLSDLREDLFAVYNWVSRNQNIKVGFVGQSVGSALVLSVANILKPAFIIAINPAADFSSWLDRRYNWDLSSCDQYFYALPKGIRVSRSFINDLIAWDWQDHLIDSQLPMLIIAASKDDIDSVSTAQKVLNTFRSAKEVIIQGGTHSFTGQRELEKKVTDEMISWTKKIVNLSIKD